MFFAWMVAIAASPSLARTSIVLFPFQQNADGELSEWVRYAVAESFFRLTYSAPGIQAWDPQFLFPVDSTGYTLDSDSLLLVHQRRWQWYAAIGGAYRMSGDSLIAQIRLVRVVQAGPAVLKNVFAVRCRPAEFARAIAAIAPEILDTIGVDLPRGFFRAEKNVALHGLAYATYACGYGYEMRRRYAEALSAYARAAELSAAMAAPLCRSAMIFRQGGDVENARALFARALSIAPNDPMIAAEAADFMIDHEPRQKSLKFVESKKEVMEASARGLCVLGKAYFAHGQMQRSIAMLTRSVVFGPRDLETEYFLGSAYFSLGKFELASEYFNRLVQFRPDYIRYYTSLGMAYRGAGLLMESARMLETAVRLSNDDPLAMTALAHTYFDLTWHEKAYELLMKVKNRWPDFNPADLNLGVIEWHVGKRREAVMLFEAAARTKATRRSALNNLGNVYFMQHKYQKALKAYRAADQIAGMRDEKIVHNMALVFLEMGKLDKAASCFEEVLALAPTRWDVLIRLQRIARRQGDVQREERYIRRMLEISPGSEEAMEAMAQILSLQQRYEEAVEFLETFLEQHPTSKRIAQALAELYRTMGWFEVSVMKYEALIAEYPADASLLLGLGRALHGLIEKKGVREQELARAIEALERCVALLPQEVEPLMLIADLFLQKGDTSRALAYLEKAAGFALDKPTKAALRARIAQLKQRSPS